MNLKDRKAMTELLKDQGTTYDSYLVQYDSIKNWVYSVLYALIALLRHLAVNQVNKKINEKT